MTTPSGQGRPAPAGAIVDLLRRTGGQSRTRIAQEVTASYPTVARTLGRMIDAGFLRESPQQSVDKSVGRPSMVVDLDPDHWHLAGIHVGQRTMTVARADLQGKVLVDKRLPTPTGSVGELVDAIAAALDRHILSAEAPPVVALGLTGPWTDLPWSPDDVHAGVASRVGLPTATSDHIAAIATADLLRTQRGLEGLTLYIYGRDTMSYVLASDGRVPTHNPHIGQLTHYGTGSERPCSCGRRGCLRAIASDEAVIEAATTAGLIEHPTMEAVLRAAGHEEVTQLLTDRAAALGRAIAQIADVIQPDRIYLSGQAFTGVPSTVPDLLESFRGASRRPDLDVRLTLLGSGIQAVAAATVAFEAFRSDPLDALGRYPLRSVVG